MTTYYVSPNGNDAWAGTSQTEESPNGPWLTVAKVVSTLTGDQSDNFVYFKKGGTWLEQYTVPCSGTSGHPFTIGAYGTGADPIIDGDDTRDLCIYLPDSS